MSGLSVIQGLKAQKTTSAQKFAKEIRHLSYAEHRYDSRSRPLFRLFTLLPVAIEALQTMSMVPDSDDAKLAGDILELFSGEIGFQRIVSAAVAADALVFRSWFRMVYDQTHSVCC